VTDPAHPLRNGYGLDPEDWDELRRLGHRMVEDVIDGFESLRERPVWQPVPAETREHFRTPLPLEPMGSEAAYEEFRRYVSP